MCFKNSPDGNLLRLSTHMDVIGFIPFSTSEHFYSSQWLLFWRTSITSSIALIKSDLSVSCSVSLKWHTSLSIEFRDHSLTWLIVLSIRARFPWACRILSNINFSADYRIDELVLKFVSRLCTVLSSSCASFTFFRRLDLLRLDLCGLVNVVINLLESLHFTFTFKFL